MADKLMYIVNDDTQNYPLCRFELVQWLKRMNTQLNEVTNQISPTSAKILS